MFVIIRELSEKDNFRVMELIESKVSDISFNWGRKAAKARII